MRRVVWIEAGRRAVPLALLTSALVLAAHGRWPLAAMAGATAIAVYAILPRETPPAGALVFDRMPAVIGPDILGFLLGAFFLGLPLAAAAFEGDPFGTIHPSAILAWPMAVFSLAILAIASVHAAYWVVIEGDGLHVADFKGERRVPFADIVSVEPYRRGLPRFIRWLTPLLIASGRYTQAGAVLLARDTTGMRLVVGAAQDANNRKDSIVVTEEGFEQPFRRIVAALKKHGVPFAPG